MIFYFQALLYGGVGAIMIGAAIILLPTDKLPFLKSLFIGNNATFTFISLGLSGAVSGLVLCHVRFRRAIKDSKERTKNLQYRKMLGIK